MRKKQKNNKAKKLMESLCRIDNNIEALDKSFGDCLSSALVMMKNVFLDNKRTIGETKELIAQLKAVHAEK